MCKRLYRYNNKLPHSSLSLPAGYAYPEAAVKHFLQQAEHDGASVLYEHPVKKLEAASNGGRVTGTTKQFLAHVDV